MIGSLKQKIIEVCDKKILTKGDNIGVSFYAFFANKNDAPELLMEHVECYWFLERIAVGSQQ